MRRRARVVSSAFALLVCAFSFASPTRAADPVPVTSCGQVVEGTGFLVGDLDCSGQTTGLASVVLRKRGRLDLAGFTITGSSHPSVYDAIRCEPKCTINGPGTVTGAEHQIASRVGRSGRVDVFGVDVIGGTIGIIAPKVNLRNVDVSGYTLAGVRTERAKIVDARLVDGGPIAAGVEARRAKLVTAIVTGNGSAGVAGGKLVALGSTITGNHTNPECGVGTVCADLVLEGRPRLKLTTCGTSLDKNACSCRHDDPLTPATDPATHNFGVCASD